MSAPAPAVGDAAELFDVEMDQLPGTGLLIAHRQPGGLIHLGQAGHAVPGQDAPHSGACQAQVVGDAVGSPPAVEPQGDDAPLSAPCQPLWAVVGGRQERSSMGWPARYRPTHRLAVAGETWKRSAARRTGQPSSTTRRARRRRPSGVSGALAWVMRASGQ